MVRQGHEILLRWTNELSLHLGRGESEITGGLSARAFSPSQRVEIRFQDRSNAQFRYAFALISEERGLVAVFTEHCGYYEFPLGVARHISQIREEVYSYDEN